MLILRRKAGESFLIGNEVNAPKEVPVLRSELAYAMSANRDAAEEQSLPQELLAAFSMLTQERPEHPPKPE